ncbi:hypothetical protein A1O7_07631 [Cladophialophora yegresii CBS 114405]|uniref:BTB domain-containing protein n=1 Tax=Cladophialophora yegresii CBS 114405 TaxID=1182544 RepID=W9WFI1_9EURO|nr:uncharacterized protein A1O7_07631 [Cladophialophora yegresii CBS 114405]EXJ57284.1 hypothetical protein A1O7_07631 [Cladophialophora yegresii CBS 114405]
MPEKRKADEIDMPEAQPQNKIIEVVPNADVTFKVGTGKDAVEVKVSGMVMGLASPVLSRMLFGQFVEAQTKTVSLPEEDPEAFLQFCNIVHHRPVRLYDLTSRQLLALAVLSDMWHSLDVVGPWLDLRTRAVRDSMHGQRVVNAQTMIEYQLIVPDLGPLPQTERFCIRDLIEICAILSLANDFRAATRHYLAVCSRDSTMVTRSGMTIPSVVNPYGETVYGKCLTVSSLLDEADG